MHSLRDLLLGDWKNKGVALFFAVTIWVVAYQSEKQEYSRELPIDVEPAGLAAAGAGTARVITEVTLVEQQGGTYPPFDWKLRLVFSGPRRQIEKVRDELPPRLTLRVSHDKVVHTFQQSDFNFPRNGVDITRFQPEAIRTVQVEEATVTLGNLSERLVVTNVREGFEVISREVHPSTVHLTGPRSFVDRLGVSASVSLEFSRERLETKASLQITHPDDVPGDQVKRLVDSRIIRVKPAEVKVTVVTQAGMDVFAAEAVRLTFRLPPIKVPVKILLDDVVGDTIPVEFYGRKDEIHRLKERIREQPGFSLGVRVPPFDRELGGQFTFTEDSLELYGFTGVQIRQHESRRKEKKTAWSYSVAPVRETEK